MANALVVVNEFGEIALDHDQSWPSDDRRSRFVFIGNGLGQETIRKSLRRLVEQPTFAH
jgi:G3E family GTPase